MGGFSDKVQYRALEISMLVGAAAGLYVGYTESDELIVTLSAGLAVMTVLHYQNTHF